MSYCELCLSHLRDDYHNLRGACASVGIEHARSTDDMLRAYMREYHRNGHGSRRLTVVSDGGG